MKKKLLIIMAIITLNGISVFSQQALWGGEELAGNFACSGSCHKCI